MRRLAMGILLAAIGCGSSTGCASEPSDESFGHRASYRYITRDFTRVIGADVTLKAGAATEVAPYDMPLPSFGEYSSIASVHVAGPDAGAIMAFDPRTEQYVVYQLSPSGSWDLVESPSDTYYYDLGCGGSRRMRAIDDNVMVLLHTSLERVNWPCGRGMGFDFYVVSRYERGIGWIELRPDDLVAAQARVNEVLPGEYEYSKGLLLDYDDAERSLTYLLYRRTVPFSVVRVDLDTWEFELVGTGHCTPDSIHTLGDGRYALECEALRYHCVEATCERIDVEAGVMSWGEPERYDRQVGALVGMSGWLENLALHTRDGGIAISTCEPVLFPDPADPRRVRITAQDGEMVYDTTTGSFSGATEPLRARLFGDECYDVTSPTPFFAAE